MTTWGHHKSLDYVMCLAPISEGGLVQHDRRCCIDRNGRGSPSRLDDVSAADAILPPSLGLGGVIGHLRAV